MTRKGQLLLVRPDASTLLVANEYRDIKKALDGATMDFAYGPDPVGAFVDDEGLLKGLQFNVVASTFVVRPLYGPAVLAANEVDGEGDTLPLEPHVLRAIEAMAERWQGVIALAARSGQDLALYANADTIPPPMIIPLPDEWNFGDPIPYPEDTP